MITECKLEVIYPIHSCLFTGLQFHTRDLLSMAISNEWLWFSSQLGVSMPEFIKKHHQGLVIIALDIEYSRVFEFFDASQFTAKIQRFKVRQQNSIFEFHHEFIADDVVFAKVLIHQRVLELSGDEALSGVPGKVKACLLQKFLPDEIEPSNIVRRAPRLQNQIEQEGQLIAKNSYPFILHRHQCEVAEQWSFIELPTLASSGRERLLLSLENDSTHLMETLGMPLKNIVAKLTCPFFLFDEGQIDTSAYTFNNRIVFIHRVINVSRANTSAAVVIEMF